VSALADLSYQAGVRALDLQERGVEQLRSRTGTLLAASSLTASFLGGQTISHTRHVGTLEILALVALAISVGLSVYVLLPKQGFTFTLNAAGIYEELFPHATDDQEVKRRLIYWLEDYWQSNQKKIEPLSRAFLVAAAALLAQMVLWSAALAANIS
jgi:hypothetical protein